MKKFTLGIIGYGAFGKFIHELAKKHLPHVPVRIHSRNNPVDSETFFTLEETCATDIIIPAVPIATLKKTFAAIAIHARPETIVVDIATVKSYTVGLLEKYRGEFQYIATHPMFGPYSYEKKGNSLKGLRLVVCERTISDAMYQHAKEFLTKLGIEVVEMTAEEHDKEIAGTLFLTHLIGQTVTKGGFRRTDIDTLSFGYLMDAVESVQNDTKLFEDVYRFNPYCKEALARFTNAEHEVWESLDIPSREGLE